MEISFPREKRDIEKHLSGVNSVYIILCQFKNGKWGIADFFGLPCTARFYRDAIEVRNQIIQARFKPVWQKEDFAIAKVTL